MDVTYLVGTAVFAVSLLLSGLLLLHHVEFRRLVRSRVKSYRSNDGWPTPPVSLIAPVKGSDVGLYENLESLFRLDYPDYEVVFVVEANGDPAAGVIRRLQRCYSQHRSRLVVAGLGDMTGQKIHNLLAAIERTSANSELLAFVDADARPAAGWLRILVNRCNLPDTGAMTGYRWLLPERNSLANLLAYSINSGAAALCGRHGLNVIWGGSWAIRRERFETMEMAAAWRNALSDDVIASERVRQSGLRTEFEPGCLVGSPFDVQADGILELLRRQFFMVRNYAPKYWWVGLGFTLVLQVGLWGSLLAGVMQLGTDAKSAASWLGASLLLYGLAAARAWLRQDAARAVLKEADSLVVPRWFDILVGPVAGLVALATMVAAGWSRVAIWRSIRYQLDRRGKIVAMDRLQDAPSRPGVRSGASTEQAPIVLRLRTGMKRVAATQRRAA